MTGQDFKNEILLNYTDLENLVTIDKHPSYRSTQNGLLHAGLFYTILKINNLITEEDRARLDGLVKSCYKAGYTGLLCRSPNHPDGEAHDDYIGVMAAGSKVFLDLGFVNDIYQYGDKHFFVYDNEDPGTCSMKRWHGRFPGLIGFYRLCNNMAPGNIQTLLLEIKIKRGVGDYVSGTILEWLMVQVMKRQSSRFNEAIEKWEKSLSAKYSSLGELFSKYFGLEHPFSRIQSYSGELS